MTKKKEEEEESCRARDMRRGSSRIIPIPRGHNTYRSSTPDSNQMHTNTLPWFLAQVSTPTCAIQHSKHLREGKPSGIKPPLKTHKTVAIRRFQRPHKARSRQGK